MVRNAGVVDMGPSTRKCNQPCSGWREVYRVPINGKFLTEPLGRPLDLDVASGLESFIGEKERIKKDLTRLKFFRREKKTKLDSIVKKVDGY